MRSSLALRAQKIPAQARAIANSAPAHKALPFFLSTAPPPAPANTRFLRMLMFGKPGAGKGTLSARLVRKYDIVSLSTGDLLRQHIAERTDVGRQAEEIVAQGGLLPDEVMLKVVTSKLDTLSNKHWILDGFPRTLVQGELLHAHLRKQNTPLSLVVNLDVPDDVILSRISDRWVHLPSGRVYNLSYNRPKVPGRDDATGEPLTRRPDDDPAVFARRLAQFYASTAPLLAFYARLAAARHVAAPRPTLLSLRGNSSDELWPRLDAAVRRAFPALRERAEPADARRRHSLSDAIAAGGEPGRPPQRAAGAPVREE